MASCRRCGFEARGLHAPIVEVVKEAMDDHEREDEVFRARLMEDDRLIEWQ